MIFDRSFYINEPLPLENELKQLFQKDGNYTFFEIGACEGEDSIKYARLFRNSKIYVFEPLPNNVKLIRQNLEKYKVKNVLLNAKALSSQNGFAEFHVSHGTPKDAKTSNWDHGNKSSSLLPPKEHTNWVDYIDFDTKIQVETITLKTFCNTHQIKEIDFVHLDVQGAELMVLEGAGEFISSIKAIWLEVSKIELYKNQPLVEDIKKFMQKNDFVLFLDCVEGDIQGDQLYLSKKYFPNHDFLASQIKKKERSLVSKAFARVRYYTSKLNPISK